MALTACKDCGEDISKKATSCPNCGAPVNRTGCAAWLMLILILLIAFMYIVGSTQPEL